LASKASSALLQADRDEDVQVQAELHRVEQRHVLPYQAGRLQRAHARQAGRGRQVDAPGQLHVGQAGVGLQFAQDAQVHGIEFHSASFQSIGGRLCFTAAMVAAAST
jgi:hypothetical protein